MTAEQLEELLCRTSVWPPISGHETAHDATLITVAPSLARRVFAAEKLVEAGSVMADALKGHYIVPGSAAAWDAALTAYREASK